MTSTNLFWFALIFKCVQCPIVRKKNKFNRWHLGGVYKYNFPATPSVGRSRKLNFISKWRQDNLKGWDQKKLKQNFASEDNASPDYSCQKGHWLQESVNVGGGGERGTEVALCRYCGARRVQLSPDTRPEGRRQDWHGEWEVVNPER